MRLRISIIHLHCSCSQYKLYPKRIEKKINKRVCVCECGVRRIKILLTRIAFAILSHSRKKSIMEMFPIGQIKCRPHTLQHHVFSTVSHYIYVYMFVDPMACQLGEGEGEGDREKDNQMNGRRKLRKWNENIQLNLLPVCRYLVEWFWLGPFLPFFSR